MASEQPIDPWSGVECADRDAEDRVIAEMYSNPEIKVSAIAPAIGRSQPVVTKRIRSLIRDGQLERRRFRA